MLVPYAREPVAIFDERFVNDHPQSGRLCSSKQRMEILRTTGPAGGTVGMAEHDRVDPRSSPAVRRHSAQHLLERRPVVLFFLGQEQRRSSFGAADGLGVFVVRRSDDQGRAKGERARKEIDQLG